MIRYPKYMTEENLKRYFRLAVMHILLLSNYRNLEGTRTRAVHHAYGMGFWIGVMTMNKTMWWRDESVQDLVFAEGKRLLEELDND